MDLFFPPFYGSVYCSISNLGRPKVICTYFEDSHKKFLSFCLAFFFFFYKIILNFMYFDCARSLLLQELFSSYRE